jgi:hypothetical protein
MSDKQEFGTEYLYSENLLANGKYQTVQVEIESYIEPNTVRSADKKLIDKPILKFKGKSKMLVLCKTNQVLIICSTGEQPGPIWIGKKITLQVREVDAFGEIVSAIRVIPPNGVKVRKNVLKRLGKEAVWVAP